MHSMPQDEERRGDNRFDCKPYSVAEMVGSSPAQLLQDHDELLTAYSFD